MLSSSRNTFLQDISNLSDIPHSNPYTSVSTEIGQFLSPPAKKYPVFSPLPQYSAPSTSFLSAGQGQKRLRSSTKSSDHKKSLIGSRPITKLVTELIDPETGKTVGFQCYFEKDVIGEELNFINNECDDDCQTDFLQIETCKDFLIRDLEKSLLNFTN